MEQIEKMLNENGQFNLDDIQILLDELVYNNDIAQESKEEVEQYKEDTNTYAKMHNEYNRNLPEYAVSIRKLQERITKINEKQQRLNGRISKREVEEKIELEQQINELKQKYEESKNNKIESKEGYAETKAKYEELIKENKQGIAESQRDEYATKLENICKYCLRKMKEKDNKLSELHDAITNCVDPANAAGYVAEFAAELNEKNQFYSNYEKVVKMISQSEEYKNVIGKDLVSELTKELEKEQKIEEPAVETPVVEEPVVETSVVEEPVVETPVVEEPVVETPVVEEPAVETPVVEEPTVETPVVEEPAVETPVVEEPAVETPVIEEPAVETSVVEEPAVETPVVEEPVVDATTDYWKMQYPTIEEVQPYSKDMSAEPMTMEELAEQGPIFKDEERIDKNYDYMSYQNAQNIGATNEENIAKKEETKEEKVGFFQKIKEKLNKEDKALEEAIEQQNEESVVEAPAGEETTNDNAIVNVEYAPEGLLKKCQFKLYKHLTDRGSLSQEFFDAWCKEQAEKQEEKSK